MKITRKTTSLLDSYKVTIELTEDTQEQLQAAAEKMINYIQRFPVRPKQRQGAPLCNLEIFKCISAELNVTLEQMREKNRKTEMVMPRKFICYFLYHFGNPFRAQTQFKKNIHHSSILHNAKWLEQVMLTDTEIVKEFDRVKAAFDRYFKRGIENVVILETV